MEGIDTKGMEWKVLPRKTNIECHNEEKKYFPRGTCKMSKDSFGAPNPRDKPLNHLCPSAQYLVLQRTKRRNGKMHLLKILG